MPPPHLLLAAGLLLGPAVEDQALGHTPDASVETSEARLQVHTGRVDPDAVRQGLELRVGDQWQRWTIEVEDGPLPDQLEVRLRDDAGHVHTRGLTLPGSTVAERSRELAASLALVLEQLEHRQESPNPLPVQPEPAPPEPPVIHGHLGIGPRVALNVDRTPAPDGGLSLVGGAWLLHDHLQPVAELSWGRSAAGELRVDALRLGGGLLAGGASARGRVWGGGGVLMRAQWAQATAAGTARGWWASPAAVGALQYRGRVIVVGAWLGADFLLPPLRARGDAHTVRWSMVRPMVALYLALRLPPGRPAALPPRPASSR